MPMTQQELGRRIRVAREGCGLTQEEVSADVGITRSAMVHIESGKRSVSSLELDRIAYLLGRDLRGFFAESFQDEDSLAALFRAQPETENPKIVLESLRHCMAFAREATALEKMLGLDRDLGGLARYSRPFPSSRWAAVCQGEELANEERRRLDLGIGPVADLSSLFEEQGIRTGLIPLPESVSGLTLLDESIGAFVVVNSSHHRLRQRFSLAHEYGHVVVDRDSNGRISRSADSETLVEVRANSFAANFLMPSEGIRAFIRGMGKGRLGSAFVYNEEEGVEVRNQPGSQAIQLHDVVRLADHFGVSRKAALYRLRNLRLITESEWTSLKELEDQGKGRRLAKLFGVRPREEEPQKNVKQRFLALALEAYWREIISRGKLRELAAMAGLDDEDFDLLFWETGLGDEALEAGD